MIQAVYTSDAIISTSADAFSLCERSSFGEKKEKAILYAPVEALFLAREQKLSLIVGNRKLSLNEIIAKLKKQDKKILTKSAVYNDLRRKGYIVKSALKFGAEFRVYEKGTRPGEGHARWILYAARENEALKWHDFAAKNRVAHSTKKNLLIAIVDDEGDVSYYECSWMRP